VKISKKKGVDGKLDVAWALLVKLKAGMKCEYCLTTTKQLHSHHIYSRSKKSTRWHVKNGICLCASHHVLNSSFSAHKTPLEFTQWLLNYKGQDYIDRLQIRANTISKLHKFEKEILLQELQNEIKSYDKI
jgi:hypothetical protein